MNSLLDELMREGKEICPTPCGHACMEHVKIIPNASEDGRVLFSYKRDSCRLCNCMGCKVNHELGHDWSFKEIK